MFGGQRQPFGQSLSRFLAQCSRLYNTRRADDHLVALREAIVEVGAWLRNLGLGRYEAAFRENEIDAEVLPDLTDADLEKLGVVMGHRKRLLKAIADLSSSDRDPASSGQRGVKIEPSLATPPNAVS